MAPVRLLFDELPKASKPTIIDILHPLYIPHPLYIIEILKICHVCFHIVLNLAVTGVVHRLCKSRIYNTECKHS